MSKNKVQTRGDVGQSQQNSVYEFPCSGASFTHYLYITLVFKCKSHYFVAQCP